MIPVLAQRRALPARPIIASGGGFSSPPSIAVMRMWLDGSQVTGEYESEPVVTWPGGSGTASASQAAVGNRPAYHENVLNGLAVVRFDGVDDYLDFSLTAPTNYAAYVVFRWTNTGSRQALLCHRKTILAIASNGAVEWWADSDLSQVSVGTAREGWNYLIVRQTGTTYTIRLNGQLLGTGTTNPLDTGAGVDRVGMFTIWPWLGDIAEVGLYDPATWGATEDGEIEGYLVDKYFDAYLTEVMADVPTAYWRFEEPAGSTTAADSSGNAHDITGISVGTLGVPGSLAEGDYAYRNNTGSGGIDFPPNLLQGCSAYTVECWAKVYLPFTGNSLVYIANAATSYGITFNLAFNNGGGAGPTIPRIQLGNGVGALWEVDSSVPVAFNTWHHYVGVWTGSSLLFYIDGVLVGTAGTASGYTGATDTNYVGSAGNTAHVGELAIYRTALSADRIAAHFQAGVGGLYPVAVRADNPAIYYRFGELGGSVLFNEIGDGNTSVRDPAVTTLAAAGLIDGDPDTAVVTNGTANGAITDYLSVPTTNFSIEIWFENNNSPDWTTIFSISDAVFGGGANNSIYIQKNGSTTQGYCALNASFLDGTFSKNVFWNNAFDGRRHHFVVTWDGLNLTVYQDAVQVAQFVSTGLITPSVTWSKFAVPTTAKGKFDEFAFYTSALPFDRVVAHYAAGAGGYIAAVRADSPIAYYRLGESSGTNAADSSGNGHNGTYPGSGITLGTAGMIAGDSDTAVTYAGSSDIPATVPAPSGDITLEAWINPASLSGVDVVLSVGQDTGGGWGATLQAFNGDLDFRVIVGGVQTSTATYTLSTGTTYHVVGVRSGTNLTLYVNGVAVETGTCGSGSLRQDNTTVIGDLRPYGWYFNGVIDEAAVYGTALSATRILAHYNAGFQWDKGFNFRNSIPYAADAPVETFVIGTGSEGEQYPTTRNGVTFGWEDSIGANERDRSSSVDRRLAGIHFATVSGTRFRVDLPATGNYAVHLAVGDPISSGSPGHWTVKDDTTTLFSVTGTGADFMDATGNGYSAANWPNNESGQTVVFTSKILRLVTSDASTNCVAHLRINRIH